MKPRFFPALLLPVVALLSACETLFFEEPVSSKPNETFAYLWKEIDEKYAFFDVKRVDWNEIYANYAPRVTEGMSDDSLFQVLGSMMNELHDGHVNLVSDFNISRFDVALLGPKNIDGRVITEHYLGDDYYITGPFVHDFIANGDVGYVRYASFEGDIEAKHLDFILNRYARTQGLILDLRQNGGGSVHNVYNLLNRLTDQEAILYTSAIKSGPDHDAFSKAETVRSKPKGDTQYTQPVMVLIDRGSYSATSFFATATKALDNLVLVGDTTGGGMGLPNGGQLPNGWTYRFSITRTLAHDGQNYENGVPPDVYVVLDQADVARGVDTVIERALQEIQKK
ncbi:Tricorn protease C1 domain-containing protein [Catalinimonas alkaloidigena]|uniref:Tricorn protease C1 domain-containing protein n=1 Tax=Catalinimonas alkaloidigena TaxID=1075417 RepID=A0A1G9QQL5_9BACT|nr:S41 family peptidase [Catalinimonas alkaloidigena]SDM13150.1 Tricorn protease C1 domain-containing protein [Catalinimonas alkaloidigena]